MNEKQPPQTSPETDGLKILHTWKCDDIVFANRLAIFFQGIGMIVRVNRPETSVELLGFEDDD